LADNHLLVFIQKKIFGTEQSEPSDFFE